jgi:alkylation response protein AidB-like acyl-CoA dehydrogenase
VSGFLSTFRLTAISPESEAFRAEVRAFLKTNLPSAAPHLRARSWMGFSADFSRRLAERNWIGVTLPKQYGGANLDPFSRFVLIEELLTVGAPVSAHWIADRQSGPLILKFGTEAQRQFYLPKICSAAAFFCIGMSEPNSGSDLASVGTRAVREKDGWRLNGRKIWTTNAHECQYMIALVRSSGEPKDRRKGLSQFVIDLSLPGITVRPICDLAGDSHFSEVFFDDVRLSEDALIGTEGRGWDQVNAELAFERSGPERIYSSIALLESWISYLRRSAKPHAHAATVGRFATHLTTLRNMSISVTARLANGESPAVEAALVKDIGTEFEQSIPAVIEAEFADDLSVPIDGELYRTIAYLSQIAPTYSLRGGTREILRGIIARGLGLR